MAAGALGKAGHEALAAGECGTAMVHFIDALQYVPKREMAALIAALYRARQNDRPIMMVGAGLPQLARRKGLPALISGQSWKPVAGAFQTKVVAIL